MTSVDLSRASGSSQSIADTIKDQYEYHSWDSTKIEKGELVRAALESAAIIIIDQVPPSPDRSAALRKLREARMDCNSAITHDGKY